MEQVNSTFRLTYIVLGVMAALGLGMHYLGGANLGRGLGAGLILVGGIGLIVDGFAERHAESYTAALESISTNPVGVDQ